MEHYVKAETGFYAAVIIGLLAMIEIGCSAPTMLWDAGDVSAEAGAVDADTESIPPSCAQTFAYLESDVFGPLHPRPRSPVPAPIPLEAGTNRVVRPETGEIGVRSWWLATAEDARITLSLSASAGIITGDDRLTIWPVINGRPAAVAMETGATEEWLDRVEIPLLNQSATVTVRLDPGTIPGGLNSVHFFWTLSTPGATVPYRDDAFPSIAVFVGSTERVPVESDNDRVVGSYSRIPFGVTEVSIGSSGPTIGHVVGRIDEVEDLGLFVHAQVSEEMARCRQAARFAYIVLVDDEPVPIMPESREFIVVDVPHDERVIVPLSIGRLPRDERPHRLQIRQVGAIGMPLEDDDGLLVMSTQFQSRLAEIAW